MRSTPGITERVGKKGKSYQVKVRGRDGSWVTETFARKTDAVAHLHKLKADLAEGRATPTQQAKKRTVGDLIDRYIEDVLPTKKAWSKKQKGHLERWKAELGGLPVLDVGPSAISEVRDRLAKDVVVEGQGKGRARPRSSASVNRYLGALSHVFTMAVKEWQWASENPVGRVRKLKEDSRHETRLTEEEVKRLLAACKKVAMPSLYTIVMVALNTGARREEILTLRWEHVDFTAGTVLFEKTKNGERKRIVMSKTLVAALNIWKAGEGHDGDHLFPKSTNLSVMFQRAVSAAKLKGRFRFHDLRHAAASFLLDAGVTTLEVAKILGHKTLAMVLRYAHAREVVGAGAVERLGAIVGE